MFQKPKLDICKVLVFGFFLHADDWVVQEFEVGTLS